MSTDTLRKKLALIQTKTKLIQKSERLANQASSKPKRQHFISRAKKLRSHVALLTREARL
jgi:hypothetical protein